MPFTLFSRLICFFSQQMKNKPFFFYMIRYESVLNKTVITKACGNLTLVPYTIPFRHPFRIENRSWNRGSSAILSSVFMVYRKKRKKKEREKGTRMQINLNLTTKLKKKNQVCENSIALMMSIFFT